MRPIIDIPKAEWPTAKCPKKCKYLDTHQICSYYIDTGIRRPCPAGAGCTVADTGKKNRPFERMIVGADGTLVQKSWQASWDTKEARRLREQGMSYRDIAARLGVSKNTICTYANLHWPDLVTKHADWDKERARAMREQGATYKAIAKAVGASESSVRIYGERHWQDLTVDNRHASWDTDKGRAMWEAGATDRQIAEACGVPLATARSYRKRNWGDSKSRKGRTQDG